MTAGSTNINRTQALGPVDHQADHRPDWTPARRDFGVAERMLTLSYRVAREAGYSPRASRRLCRRLLRDTPFWPDTPPGADASGPDAGRRTRARLLLTLRAAMSSRVDGRVLERALDSAVLADELTLLPPRQQAVLRWVVQQRCTVRQISERTGWTPQQVTRLLRAGLTTLAVYGKPSQGISLSA